MKLAPTNPYEQVRSQLARADRRSLSNAIRQRLGRKPVTPDEMIDLDEHLLDLEMPQGMIRLICVTRSLPVEASELGKPFKGRKKVSEITVRVRRGFAGDDKGNAEEVWTPPTWFEIALIRALAWHDEAEVVVVMAPAGDFRHLDVGAVHLRGPAPR